MDDFVDIALATSIVLVVIAWFIAAWYQSVKGNRCPRCGKWFWRMPELKHLRKYKGIKEEIVRDEHGEYTRTVYLYHRKFKCPHCGRRWGRRDK